MSREQDTVAPAIDRDTAETGRMRLRGVVDEAWRDIVSGTSHAFMLMLILAALVGGLSAADLFSIRSIAQQVDRYIASGASTYVIEFKGRISGEACERLSSVDGVLASGALRSRNDKVTSAVLPSAGIPSLDATTRKPGGNCVILSPWDIHTCSRAPFAQTPWVMAHSPVTSTCARPNSRAWPPSTVPPSCFASVCCP